MYSCMTAKLLAMWRRNMQGERLYMADLTDAHELVVSGGPGIIQVIKYRTMSLTFSSKVGLSAAKIAQHSMCPRFQATITKPAFVAYDDIRVTGTISELSVVWVSYINHMMLHA